ncbi:hypothetical protein Tco_1029125 [Tanacetum coccineum]|uniref:Uncharacterized protein n=1 Tax=Tanacetum coccineum TaxID=301880 RepID=A0ABQ5G328_9ASTR
MASTELDNNEITIARPTYKKKGGANLKKILLVIIPGVVLISLISTWLWFAHKRRNHVRQMEGGGLLHDSKNQDEAIELPLFSFSRIATATSSFSPNNILGRGGFGPVYKISDFGLARRFKGYETNDKTKNVAGTMEHMHGYISPRVSAQNRKGKQKEESNKAQFGALKPFVVRQKKNNSNIEEYMESNENPINNENSKCADANVNEINDVDVNESDNVDVDEEHVEKVNENLPKVDYNILIFIANRASNLKELVGRRSWKDTRKNIDLDGHNMIPSDFIVRRRHGGIFNQASH